MGPNATPVAATPTASRRGADLGVDGEADADQVAPSSTIDRVPFVELHREAMMSKSEFDGAYGRFQALHVRGHAPAKGSSGAFRASDVRPLFESLGRRDKASWCIENDANNLPQGGGEGAARPTPSEFLVVGDKRQRGYCSFLVQHSRTPMNELLSEGRLPLRDLPVADESGDDAMEFRYGPCLWWFFGANYDADKSPSPTTLRGRPEHTDSVAHDGTWHYQLSGTKIWRLRPTSELMQKMGEGERGKKSAETLSGTKRKIGDTAEQKQCDEGCIEVECKEGDILLLNTRLWWHSTLIPPQSVPCISYARDVFFPDPNTTEDAAKAPRAADEHATNAEGKNDDSPPASMTNVDGTYAANDIEADTILFTEQTMPDCQLHQSKTDPNCQVVELEDEATGGSYMAVVSLRAIKAGEFFCVLESDDEEEAEGDDGTDEWEEDGS